MIRWFIPLCFMIAAGPLAAADFTPLDRQAAKRLLDPESHRQPTVIALWSSDCNYCKKNLNLLSSLAKKNKNLRLITVAAEPEIAELLPMLKQYALTGPRYAYGTDNPEAIAYAIDPNWHGELPRTFLFDGRGGKAVVAGVISTSAVEKLTALRFQSHVTP
jgi:thiol-disulfide isomerase/thioredoxin